MESISLVDPTVAFYVDQIGVNMCYDPNAEPTDVYKKIVMTKDSPGFKHLGRVKRYVFYKKINIKPNIVCTSFLQTEEDVLNNFKITHRQCSPNGSSGYTAVQHYSKLPPRNYDSDGIEFCVSMYALDVF